MFDICVLNTNHPIDISDCNIVYDKSVLPHIENHKKILYARCLDNSNDLKQLFSMNIQDDSELIKVIINSSEFFIINKSVTFQSKVNYLMKYVNENYDSSEFTPIVEYKLNGEKTSDLNIYQIYFDDKHLNILDSSAIPYYNKELTPYFENDIIIKLIENNKHKNCKYFGVIGYSFIKKLGWTPTRFRRTSNTRQIPSLSNYKLNKQLIKKYYDEGYHLIYYVVGIDYIYTHRPVAYSLVYIIHQIGKNHVDLAEFANKAIYCNYYIAIPELWDLYYKEYLAPVKKLMEENETVKQLIWEDANYQGNIPKDDLIKNFGVPYYPQHSFILERLINYFLAEHREFKIIYSADLQF